MTFFEKYLPVRIRQEEHDRLEEIIEKNPELESMSHAVRTAIIQFISNYDYGKDKFELAAEKLEQYKKDKIGKI